MKTNTIWSIDPTHSEVLFKVKHLVISTVTGQFKEFNGQLESENENFNDAKIFFEASVKSISTNNQDRDTHLKSPDFFDVEKYPTVSFESTSFKESSGDYSLEGNLTIKDITKKVNLNVEFGGVMVDPYGNTKAGFEISGKINRKDFGLTWSAVTEAGGVVVGDELKLIMNVQVVKQ